MIRHNEGIIHAGLGNVHVTGPVGRLGKFIQFSTPSTDTSVRTVEDQNEVEKADVAFLTKTPVDTLEGLKVLHQRGG